MKYNHHKLVEELAIVKGTIYRDVSLGPKWARKINDPDAETSQIADVLTVKPSYEKLCISIYEVKVSRADFLTDDKWRGYLPHCHRFYFAVPSGLVKIEEVPPEAGLIICGEKNWTTVKAAPVRDVQIPYDTLLSLIFMKNRTTLQKRNQGR